jgi:hypothetical protein
MSLGNKIRNTLLVIVSTVLVVFITDLVIRYRYPIPQKGYGIWAACPGSTLDLVMAGDDFETRHRYNRFGFRGPDFDIVPASAYRIACVGDSYTEGVGAPEDHSWPAVLGRELAGQDVEVLNLGDSGSGMARYASIVCKVALPLKPTDIILCLNTLDLRHGPQMPKDMEVRQEFNNPFRDRRSVFGRALVTIVPGWVYLTEHARGRWPVQKGFYWRPYEDKHTEQAVDGVAGMHNVSSDEARRIVEERMTYIAEGLLEASRERKFNPTVIQNTLVTPFWTYECQLQDISQSIPDMRRGLRLWLKWFAAQCRRQQARAWVLYFPEASLVKEGYWGAYQDQIYSQAPNIVGDASVRDLLGRLCDNLSIGFIDTTPVLIQHSDEHLFSRYDPHPTARAYELVAQHVAREIGPAF